MKRTFFVAAFLCLAVWSMAWADSAVESAQQKLKDEGFYYGEIHGKKDADTTAAIRRYQIRHGLQITGDLNDETLHALGLSSKPASTPATRPAQTPGPTPPGFREEEPPETKSTPAPRYAPQQPEEEEDAPEPPPRVDGANPFSGTPYQDAPPHVQQDIVSRAQFVLMRLGFYREAIDGAYGPAMDFALRNYQTRVGLRPSGRLDVETLASLRLLPEQRVSGFRRFHQRFFPPAQRFGPWNEPIYVPR